MPVIALCSPVHNLKIRDENICQKIKAYFEFNTGCSSCTKITFVVGLHISETMPFVCAKNVLSQSHPNGASLQLVTGLLLLHYFIEQLFLNI